MKSILFVEAEVKVKMKHQEELRLNSWFKCRVLVMIMMVSLSLEQQIHHGNLIQLSEEDLKKESIYPFLMSMQEQLNLKLELDKLQMI